MQRRGAIAPRQNHRGTALPLPTRLAVGLELEVFVARAKHARRFAPVSITETVVPPRCEAIFNDRNFGRRLKYQLSKPFVMLLLAAAGINTQQFAQCA